MRDLKKVKIRITVVTVLYLILSVFLIDMIKNDRQTYSDAELNSDSSAVSAVLSKTYEDYFSIDPESIRVKDNQIIGVYLTRDGTEVPYVLDSTSVSNKDDGRLYLLLISSTIVEILFVILTLMHTFYKKTLLEDRTVKA